MPAKHYTHYLLDDNGEPYPLKYYNFALDSYEDLDYSDPRMQEQMRSAAEFYSDINKRRVAITERDLDSHHVTISTVFLMINHNHLGEGAPVLFETMVFHGESGDEMWRYNTRAQAEEGHRQVVNAVDQVIAKLHSGEMTTTQFDEVLHSALSELDNL